MQIKQKLHAIANKKIMHVKRHLPHYNELSSPFVFSIVGLLF